MLVALVLLADPDTKPVEPDEPEFTVGRIAIARFIPSGATVTSEPDEIDPACPLLMSASAAPNGPEPGGTDGGGTTVVAAVPGNVVTGLLGSSITSTLAAVPNGEVFP